MYKYIGFLAYVLIFVAFFPVASVFLGVQDMFFTGIPYPYSLPFDYKWYILGAGITLKLLAWLSARSTINEVTDSKNYTRATFSKRKKELIKSGKKGEKKLKHLAMRTGWAPILQPSLFKKGWQNMSSNKTASLRIKSNRNGVLRLAPSLGRSLFNIYISLIGVVLLTSSFWATESSGSDFWVYSIGIAMLIGGVLLFKLHTDFYFDKKRNEFVEVANTFLNNTAVRNKKILSLDEIAALQIICNYKRGNNPGFNQTKQGFEWELNIIRKNAKRHNIIIASNRVALTKSAMAISDFLNVPVWEDIGAHIGLVQEKTVTIPTWDSFLDKFSRKNA